MSKQVTLINVQREQPNTYLYQRQEFGSSRCTLINVTCFDTALGWRTVAGYAWPGPSYVLWCTAPQVNFAFENLQQDSVPPPFDPLMDLLSIPPMSNENEPNLAGLEPDEIT